MAEPRIKIFTFGDNSFYPPAAFLNLGFNIPANNRELKIRSLYFNVGIRQTVPAVANVPFEMNTNIFVNLLMGTATAGDEFSSMFNFTLGAPSFNGTALNFNRPGQYHFNSFTIFNSLPFTLAINNYSAANTYQIFATVAVEVEEKISWQFPQVEPLKIEL